MRDLDVGQLVCDAKRDGAGGRGRKLLERCRQRGSDRTQIGELFDARQRRVVELNALDPKPPARSVVNALAPHSPAKLMTRDAQQPRIGWSTGVAVAPAAGERRREGLGGEISGLLRIPRPAGKKGEQPFGVPVIKLAERLRTATGFPQ